MLPHFANQFTFVCRPFFESVIGFCSIIPFVNSIRYHKSEVLQAAEKIKICLKNLVLSWPDNKGFQRLCDRVIGVGFSIAMIFFNVHVITVHFAAALSCDKNIQEYLRKIIDKKNFLFICSEIMLCIINGVSSHAITVIISIIIIIIVIICCLSRRVITEIHRVN